MSVCRLYRVVVLVAEWWHKMLPWQHLLLQQWHPLLWLHLVSFDWLEFIVFSRSGLSESFEVDGRVVKVSDQSRDILFEKKPFLKKC